MPSLITGLLTLPKVQGLVYQISGQVNVGVDVGTTGTGTMTGQLVVEPGVVLFGSVASDRLVVQRGSTISAQGGSTDPIIFTSRDDLLNLNGPNSIGQWGGLAILGRAPISGCDSGSPSNPNGVRTDCERQASGTGSSYGGTDPLDGSGVLNLLQIRYAGTSVGSGTAGLELDGVGRTTVIANVQVHNSGDRGILISGGRVNASGIAATGAEVEGFTTADGHQGALQQLIVTQRAGTDFAAFNGGFSGFEDALPRGNFQLSNFTIVGAGTSIEAMRLGGGGDYGLFNGVVAGADQCFRVVDTETVRAADGPLQDDGPPIINSVVLTCPTAIRVAGGPTQAEVEALFTNGSNNDLSATSSLMMGFINGANENGVPDFDPTAVSSFFTDLGFIGAVQNTNNARFQDWTCGLYAGSNCIGVAEAFS